MTTSAAAIIDAKGGPTAFASQLNKRPGAARVWKYRNRLPREIWPEIIRAFPDITLETLMAIEPPRPDQTTAA